MARQGEPFDEIMIVNPFNQQGGQRMRFYPMTPTARFGYFAEAPEQMGYFAEVPRRRPWVMSTRRRRPWVTSTRRQRPWVTSMRPQK